MRFFLVATTLLALLLVTPILLMREGYAANRDLEVLLFPRDCLQPCVMGLQPGQTPMEEAREILLAHPWIATAEPIPDQESTLQIEWNGEQPLFLFGSGRVFTRGGVVDRVELPTLVSFGAVRLALKRPDASFTSVSGTARSQFYAVTDIYRAQRMRVRTTITCPVTPLQIFGAPATLTWYAPGGFDARDVRQSRVIRC